jgi:tetratricopeptide (TPR) repeat protein
MRAVVLVEQYFRRVVLGLVIAVLGMGTTFAGSAQPEQYIDRQLRFRQYFDRGMQLIEANHPREALEYFNRALKLDPRGADALVSRGYARAMLKDYKGALADQTEALRVDPRLAEAYANRGTSRYRLGDRKGARADWQKAVALFREQKNAERASQVEEVLGQFR